ncbi:MAG: thiamine pyrophosphate-binding protein [Opitutaceae bacterium]|jgi:indolepyruvate ferredoxin oxidoreductase alpha subunit|nr:thiamine pyrophosphate-binding protein [Opitutaceae bacterium]
MPATENTQRILISGDEAVSLAALHSGVALGAGYPGTPSTEILETFAERGGRAQWCPNEKVALEVAIGASFAGARAIATMKHVGLNVAADPLFTVAYTGVSGALIIISADDPGLASSQNEQDNRRYAVAAGVPMFEPADSQEAYDFLREAVAFSEKWKTPVLFRVTTRVCHAKTLVTPRPPDPAVPAPAYTKDIRSRVMVPAFAKPAHLRLRKTLADIAAWNNTSALNRLIPGGKSLGIIASGIAFAHAREAAPSASFLKLGLTHPLPEQLITDFVKSVDRAIVIEEGDPFLADAIRALGLNVESKPPMFRFGELNVNRVRRILANDTSPEPLPPPGKPPGLCEGCGHRAVFETLRDLGCVVSGDIGCYTLGVLPPFGAVDTCVCMGASIGVALGMRHVLPPEKSAKIVSVIGDSTFMHSGLTGLVEMIYNPPQNGHTVIILDNSTTAMTGHQENPGTGRNLLHDPTGRVVFENLIRGLGINDVHIIDPRPGDPALGELITSCLGNGRLNVIIARRPCILAAARIREYDRRNAARAAATCPCEHTPDTQP